MNHSRGSVLLRFVLILFFDSLREEGAKLPNGDDLPPLFNFSVEELNAAPPSARSKLVPARFRNNYDAALFV